MDEVDFLARAREASGASRALTLVALSTTQEQVGTSSIAGSLYVDGRPLGWCRWRSMLIVGDRVRGLENNPGPPLEGEWVVSEHMTARLPPGVHRGENCEVSLLTERPLDGEPRLEGAEQAALREIVHLLHEKGGRAVYHIYWTVEDRGGATVARTVDRLAGYEVA